MIDRDMYTAVWPSAATVQMLRDAGITKEKLHMTTFFDGYDQLKWLKPYPWVGPQSATIVKVTEWRAPSGKRLLVAELQCPNDWSRDINRWYRQQGAREDLPHKPHMTLGKRVPEGTAAHFQGLVGKVVSFDRHGFEEPRP